MLSGSFAAPSGRRRRSRLGAVLFGLMAGWSAGGAHAVFIEIDPNQQVFEIGTTASVAIGIGDLMGEVVSAYDLDLLYDAAIVAPIGVTFGTTLGNPSFFEVLESVDLATPGVVDLAALSLLPDPTLLGLQGGDSVRLASILFRGIAAGTSSLDFVFDAFNDVKGANGQILDLASSGALLTVTGPVAVPEPSMLALMLCGGTCLAYLRRRRASAWRQQS